MKKRGLLKTADNWIGANRREPQALSHKPSFSRPIQSDPSLSPPNTIQANPIRTKIVSAAYLDFEPAVKLCLHTVQFRSRSSEIWWLTTNCTAERVPVSSSVMAVWGLWDSTKVKPILGLGNEYNCERIFYMWRRKKFTRECYQYLLFQPTLIIILYAYPDHLISFTIYK